MEYLQGPDLWHMIEACERDACDVVVVEGTMKKERNTDGLNNVHYFDNAIYGIKQ